MHVEIIDCLDDIGRRPDGVTHGLGQGLAEGLGEVWSDIERQNPSLPVFQSWHWNATWCRTVMPHLAGSELRCFVALSGSGHPVAIVPCFRSTLMGGMLTLTQLLGHRMTFMNDIVSACPDDTETAMRVLAAVHARLQPREIVHLRHLHADAAFTRALVARDLAEVQCQRLYVRNDGAGDPLARLPRKRRRDLVWRENKLRKTLGGHYRVVPEAEFDAAFDRLCRLHRARFDARGATTLLDGANADFLRTVCLALCRTGNAEILELCAGDRTIAALVGIVDNGRYYAMNGGFDAAFGEYSPMKLLLTQAMRHAFADLACTRVELGPDYEAYKQTWHPERADSYTACLNGRGLYSRVSAAGYRWAFRKVVARAASHRRREPALPVP